MKTKLKKIMMVIITIACSTNAFAQLPPYVPTSGLVSWYSFTGNANDLSGNNNNGTVFGTTLTADRFGNTNSAYSFYGTDDYIEIGTAAGNFDNQSYSISFWVRTNQPADTIDPVPAIISRLNNSGSVYDNFCIFESGGKVHLNYQSGASMLSSAYCPTDITGNAWHNVVISVDSVSIKSYLDGLLKGSQAYVGGIAYQNYPIRFGRSSHPYWADFSGELDDIGIWNRALSQAEVFQLYTSGTSIQHYQNQSLISVYPNPSTGKFTLDSKITEGEISIYNLLGETVFLSPIEQLNNSTIDLFNQPNGIYLMNIKTKKESFTQKIIIQK